MREKILVSGGAGFIGSNVVDRYIKEGYDVVVVDNLSTGFSENVNPEAKFYNADIGDRKKIREIFETEKPGYLSHHAAQIDVRKSVEDPCFDALTNIVASIKLIEESVRAGIKKLKIDPQFTTRQRII